MIVVRGLPQKVRKAETYMEFGLSNLQYGYDLEIRCV